MPSRRWQMSGDRDRVASLMRNAGCAAAARSTNRCAAANRAIESERDRATGLGRGERRHRIVRLAGDAQRLAARREDPDVPGPTAAAAVAQRGARVDQVLAVVEDHEQPPVARRYFTSASATGCPASSLTPSTIATACRRAAGRRAARARRTRRRRDSRPCTSAATCSDRRVLPMPPGPDQRQQPVLREQLLDLRPARARGR